MSRFYKMEVNVREVQKKNIKKVLKVCEEYWDFEEIENHPEPKGKLHYIYGDGYGNLCGGMSEDEFAKNLAKQIKKVDKKCKVNIGATYLEAPPQLIPITKRHASEH